MYLGLPLYSGPTLDSFWSSLIDRVQSKLARWKGALFSQVGKLQLIKDSLQNLLVYAMSLFKIPPKILDPMEKIQNNFLWMGIETKNQLHLVAWD